MTLEQTPEFLHGAIQAQDLIAMQPTTFIQVAQVILHKQYFQIQLFA
jgi:hypothetical protein